MTWSLITGDDPSLAAARDRHYVLHVGVEYVASEKDSRKDTVTFDVRLPAASPLKAHSRQELALATHALVLHEVDSAIRILMIDTGMLPRPSLEQTARDRCSLWFDLAFLKLAPDQAEVAMASGRDLTLRRLMASGTTLEAIRENVSAALEKAASGPMFEAAVARGLAMS